MSSSGCRTRCMMSTNLSPKSSTIDRAPSDLSELEAECGALCLYLIRETPSPYIVECYETAHRVRRLGVGIESDRFDRILLLMARTSTFGARLADTYTRWFCRRSVLRRKLLLLLAILECAPSTFGVFDKGTIRGQAALGLRMASSFAGFLICGFLGIVMLSPIHLILRIVRG